MEYLYAEDIGGQPWKFNVSGAFFVAIGIKKLRLSIRAEKIAKHIDTLSEWIYNKHADTESARRNDEGLHNEKSNTGTDCPEKGRNHQCL